MERVSVGRGGTLSVKLLRNLSPLVTETPPPSGRSEVSNPWSKLRKSVSTPEEYEETLNMIVRTSFSFLEVYLSRVNLIKPRKGEVYFSRPL